MGRAWVVTSDAGDGINGKSFKSLDDARAAVERKYGPGEWDEVAGEPTSPENAWEYFVAPESDDDSVARIEFALVS